MNNRVITEPGLQGGYFLSPPYYKKYGGGCFTGILYKTVYHKRHNNNLRYGYQGNKQRQPPAVCGVF